MQLRSLLLMGAAAWMSSSKLVLRERGGESGVEVKINNSNSNENINYVFLFFDG